MRLAIVSQEYPGVSDYYGGIGTQYGALAPALAALGVDIHVITLVPRGASTASRVVDGVHAHPLGSGYYWPWHAALWSRRVTAKLREIGPFDAVLTPEFRGELHAYAARQDAGPLVTHLLTSSAQLLALRPGLTFLERHGPRTKLFLAMERRQAERSASLLAPGQAVVEWARELWPSTRDVPARTLPLTIDAAMVREKAAAGELPDGFPSGRGPIVMLASRLDGHKGAEELMDAMRRVWRAHPDAQLVYLGRDSRYEHTTMSTHLRERAGADAHRVHVIVDQPRERYFAAVAAADLVAIPSRWESFCLAAVEAMLLGKPVIGSLRQGFEEYVRPGENGLLVEAGEVEPLAEALRTLLDDPGLRERMGAAAASTAEALDTKVVAPRYAELLAP